MIYTEVNIEIITMALYVYDRISFVVNRCNISCRKQKTDDSSIIAKEVNSEY